TGASTSRCSMRTLLRSIQRWRRSAGGPAVTIQVAFFGMTTRSGSWDSRPVVLNRRGSRFDREASSWRPGRAWINDVNQSNPNRPHCEAYSTAPWPPDNTVNLGQNCSSQVSLLDGATTPESCKSRNGGGTRQISTRLAPSSDP